MRLLKVLSTTAFVITAAACITQIGAVTLQESEEEKSEEKSLPHFDGQEDTQNFDDCGYQEIIVENPDKTKTIIIIPLECVDEPVDSVCDPTFKDPTEQYVVDGVETVSL